MSDKLASTLLSDLEHDRRQVTLAMCDCDFISGVLAPIAKSWRENADYYKRAGLTTETYKAKHKYAVDAAETIEGVISRLESAILEAKA